MWIEPLSGNKLKNKEDMTLHEECTLIQSFTDAQCGDNPEELIERIQLLSSYLSRTGWMLKEAKKELNIKKTAEIQKTIIAIAKEACLSANVQNALLKSICIEESELVDWIDRLNATCTHQIDACRSILSWLKEDLRVTKAGY